MNRFIRSVLAVVTLAVIAGAQSLPLSGTAAEADNAGFASQLVPGTLRPGQTNLISVRMVNSGATTWSAANQYFLGAVNPEDNLVWGVNRVSLFTNVAPGRTATFNFEIVAPLATGGYNLQWQMTREGGGFFGQPSSNAVVTVIPAGTPGNAASFVAQSVPTQLAAAATATVAITLRNTGTTTWSEATRHRLGAINPMDNRLWNVRRAYLASPVPPGALGTFTFAITAPGTPGSYNFQWMMLQEVAGRFGTPTPNLVIQVSEAAARPPWFLQQPLNKTVLAGNPAELTAVAVGPPPPALRWQSQAPGTAGFADIPGATAGTYLTPVLFPADNGAQFRCVATNAAGSATSAVATVTVLGVGPSFTLQPTNQSVFAGETATFTVAAAGTPAPTLQWQSKAATAADFTNLPGATAGTCVTPVLLPADDGSQFRCLASSVAGTATSAVATVTVIGVSPSFTQQPTDQSAFASETATFTVAAAGTPPPTLQWQSKAATAADFTNLPGATAGTCVTPVLLPADDGSQFRCVASSVAGTATSAVATVTVIGVGPSFTQQPTDQSAFASETTTFTVAAAGTPPPTLQWQSKAATAVDFTNLPGANVGTYVTPALTLADNHSQFRCLASSAAGTAFSAPATLTVLSNSAPGYKRIHPRMDLQSGDTVVFLGDSITYLCLYTQYFEDFYYTRFPKVRVRFRNAGVAGDRATNALVRFDDDVAAFRPKYVTVLLGMNDGGYRDFDKPTFDTYQRNMTTLIDRIAQLGAIAVPITPTMHDGRAARLRNTPSEPRDTLYNGVLGLYGAWLREVAYTRGLGFADVYAPLNHATTDGRKTDAGFTLIPDAIHPNATGQVVMAVALLNDLGLRGPVSSIFIQEKNGLLTATADHGQLTDFTTGDNISFTFTANALPWVLPDDAQRGYQLTQAGPNLSLEKFTAQDLPPGTYELRIDTTPVGTYTAGQLAAGLELQENDKTPQFQQALRVAQLNKDKSATAIRPLRKWWEQLRDKRLALDLAIANHDPDLDAKRAAFAAWLLTFQAGVATLQTLANNYEDQIYQANQPPPRRYELLRVNSAARAR